MIFNNNSPNVALLLSVRCACTRDTLCSYCCLSLKHRNGKVSSYCCLSLKHRNGKVSSYCCLSLKHRNGKVSSYCCLSLLWGVGHPVLDRPAVYVDIIPVEEAVHVWQEYGNIVGRPSHLGIPYCRIFGCT